MRRTQDQLFNNLYECLDEPPRSTESSQTTPDANRRNTRRDQLAVGLVLILVGMILAYSPEVQSAPTPADVNTATSTQSEAQPASSAEIQRAKELDWTFPKENDEKLAQRATAREFFYHYRQSLSAMAGPAYRTDAIQDPDTQLSLKYWRQPTDGLSLEAGADLVSDGTGALHLSKKSNTGRGQLRGYLSYGLAIRIVPNEQLVTFLKIQNWQIRGAMGAEWQWPWGKSWSLRGELGVNLSPGRVQLPILIGATSSF